MAAEATPAVERALATGRPVYAVVAPMDEERPDRIRRSDLAAFEVREEFVHRLQFDVANLAIDASSIPRDGDDDGVVDVRGPG